MLNKNKNRNVAFLLACCILFVLLFSRIFITTHIHHECSGERCPICAEIQLAEAVIQQIGSAIQTVVILIALIYIIKKIICISNPVNLFLTPVDKKVRMND